MIGNRATDTDDGRPFVQFLEARAALALEVLDEYDEALPLADVADEVAVRETGRSLEEIPATDVLWVYDDLYFEHVPLLERAGLVRYEQEKDTLRIVEP
ncbi:MAG: hypothetical protein ABEJ22_08805 [Haloferacaceae archaeon]